MPKDKALHGDDAEPRIRVPGGVLLGRDKQGRKIMVHEVIVNTDLIDSLVPETISLKGARLLMETGRKAIALRERWKGGK